MQREADERAAQVSALVREHLPGYRVHSVTLLGEGLDNVVYEVNGELMVRFGKAPDPGLRAARADREARLLTVVAGVSPLPIPEPRFVAADQGCFAYAKLPGVALLELAPALRPAHAAAVAATLGGLLAALHSIPAGRVAGLVDTDDEPLVQWRQDAAGLFATVAGQVPAGQRGPIAAFLRDPPPAGTHRLAFSHNDLGIEHVLIDPATWAVTGIVDWSDAAITDPAYDFGLLCRDLGPAALVAALASYQPGGDACGIRERAVFYARCAVLEDLAHGLATGHDAYVSKSLAALRWLFPA